MLEQKSLDRDRAYNKLVDLILAGKLSETTQISERGLAAFLDLGRTPIREAIRDLVREGVFETHPARGTFVRPLSLDDIQEIYQVRIAIEGLACVLAADKGATEKLHEYAEKFQAALASPDDFNIKSLHDEGAEFHVEIFRSAKNKMLMQIYRPIRLRFHIAFGLPRQHGPERVMESVGEHAKIAQAIVDRNGQHAQHLMGDHLRRGLAFRMGLLRSSMMVEPSDRKANN